MSTDFKQIINLGEKELAERLIQIFSTMSSIETERSKEAFAKGNKVLAANHQKQADGYETGALMIRVHNAWLKAVGEKVAQHIQPQTVKGNCLYLLADNPIYAQEFFYLKNDILKKLHDDSELSFITTMKTRFHGNDKKE